MKRTFRKRKNNYYVVEVLFFGFSKMGDHIKILRTTVLVTKNKYSKYCRLL